MKINKPTALLWEVSCESVSDLQELGSELCDLSHKGLGNSVKVDDTVLFFHILFNGVDIEFQSARDLWFFGYGLLLSVNSLPIKFGPSTKKMVH